MRTRWIVLGCVAALACGDDDESTDAGRERDASSDTSADTTVDGGGEDSSASDSSLDSPPMNDAGECAVRCGEECVDSCGDCPGAPLECEGTCVSSCDAENCPRGVAMRDSFACGDRCVPFPFCCPCEGDAYRCRDGSCVDDCSGCSGQRDNCEFGYCTVGADETSCRPTEVSCEGCPEGTSTCNGTCVDDCSECPEHPFSCAPRSGTWPHCREDVWDCDSPPTDQVRCPDGSVEDECGACEDGASLLKCNSGGWCVERCDDCERATRSEPDACGSLCVDFQFDDWNCGECGHSCLVSGPPFLSCISGECIEF